MTVGNSHRTVVVTDSGLGSAIAIIRSLGRRGWRVIAVDSDRNSLGFRSRYTSERVVFPSARTSPREFIGAMLDLLQKRHVDLVIPVTDAVIRPLSEARHVFDGRTRLALPDHEALLATIDKSRTLELAERLQVPVPRTALVTTACEAADRATAFGWPVVLKPQTSYVYGSQRASGSLTVSYAQNQDQLIEQVRKLEGRCAVLLQEYYPGVGYGVELLLRNGRPLAAFAHKRLREIPVSGGASAFCESVPLNPLLFDYATRLLEELEWTGLAMVEFKLGADGAKLMEINGRVWGSLPLAVRCGMDFPYLLAELYMNGLTPTWSALHTNYRVGVRARNLELDLMWMDLVLRGERPYPFIDGPRRSQAFGAVLDMLNPACKFDILSLEDPRPGLAQAAALGAKIASRLWTHSPS